MDKQIHFFFICQPLTFLFHNLYCGLRITQPLAHMRKLLRAFRIKRTCHRTTSRMTAHNNMLDTQNCYGILDRGRGTACYLCMRRNNISRITADKKLTRLGLCQKARVNPAV